MVIFKKLLRNRESTKTFRNSKNVLFLAKNVIQGNKTPKNINRYEKQTLKRSQWDKIKMQFNRIY